jgi:hypothetical protein
MRTALASLALAAPLVAALAFGAWCLDVGLSIGDWLVAWPIVAGWFEVQARGAEQR